MSPSSARFPAVDFRAPIGARVRLVTMLVFVILLLLALVPHLLPRVPSSPFDEWSPLFAPVLGLPVVVPALVLARVKSYRLVDDELHVVRVGRTNRIPLAGLRRIDLDPAALERAWKTWGNDGLGAITGRFRSRKLGRFDALLTDTKHAVILRWPNRTLVVSPERAAFFVTCVRERMSLPA